MSVEQSILSIISGGFVGLSLGLLGGGGSILAVPLLLYVVRLKNPHVVIGTSALAVSMNAFVNLVTHARHGHVRWLAAVGFSVPGIAGAFVGSELGKRVHGSTLLFLFAILMFVIAVLMMRRGSAKGRSQPARSGSDRDADSAIQPPDPPTLRWVPITASGFLVGAMSGFFGIGGGFLIVPALIFAADFSFIEAIGTSLVAVGLFGLTTAVTYSLAGLINWLAFAEFVAGGAIGGFLGARLAHRLSQQRATLNYIFGGVIIVVAIYMLYKNALAFHL